MGKSFDQAGVLLNRNWSWKEELTYLVRTGNHLLGSSHRRPKSGDACTGTEVNVGRADNFAEEGALAN